MKPGNQHIEMDLAAILESLPWVLRGCWRFRWPAVGAAWVLCLVGWAYTLTVPNMYEASTRLYVDTKSTLRPLLEGLAVNPDLTSDVNLMMRAILSRPTLERIARDTDLDLEIHDQGDLEGLVDRLLASIHVSKDRNNILRIAYTHSNSEAALAVVSALLNEFIEGSLGANRTDAKSAEVFLEGKLRDYELRLNESEQRLADFKKLNVGMMPGEGGDYFARLQLEIDRLEMVESRRNLARQRRDELVRQLEGEEPVFGLMSSDPVASGASGFDSQIAQYEQQLTEMRLRFTDTHPDIVQIKGIIEDLQAKKAERVSAQPRSSQTYSALDANPVYQQMKMQHSQVEVDLAELNAQYASQKTLVRNLKQKVDTIPDIEAELSRLTRDHQVTRTQYSQLLVRLESARLSEAAEESKSDIKFQILDPPSVPVKPTGPNRVLLETGVLIVGLGAGVFLTIALNFIWPVFFSARQLERVFGISVLGVIGVDRADIAQGQARLGAFLLTASMVCLLITYGLVVVFSDAGANMAGQLMSVVGS